MHGGSTSRSSKPGSSSAQRGLTDSAGLSALLRAADALNVPDPHEVARMLAEILLEVTEHARSTVASFDEETGELEVVASAGSEPLLVGGVVPLEDVPEALREAFWNKRTMVVEHATLPRPTRGVVAEPFEISSALLVALVRRDRPIGLLMLDDPEERRPFTDREIGLVEAIAAQAAIALDNARLLSALARSEAKARSVVLSAPAGIYELDLRTRRFVSVNDAVVAWSGYSREELLAMHAEDILGDESKPFFRQRVAAAQAGEELPSGVEYTVRGKDGSEIVVAVDVRRLPDETGAITRLLVIAHDVTARVKVEEERQRLLEAEQRSARLASTLNRINEILLSVLTTGEMLDRIAQETALVIGADKVTLVEIDGESAEFVATYGLPPDLVGQRFPLAASPALELAERTRRPRFVEDTLASTETNRDFSRRYGTRAAMTLPLIVAERVIGEISYIYDAPRHFDEHDREFARQLGVAMSLALENARHYESERRIADRLQDALLSLPVAIPGIEFAHEYRAASEAARVGGDFYDLFHVDQDHVGVVVGDVAGKGLDAAVLTSLVKDTIRAHVNEKGKTPAEVLRLANDVVYKRTPAEAFATVFFGVLDCRDGSLVYANAGHTTGAIVRRAKPPVSLPATGPLLGGLLDVAFDQADARLEKGDVLFLYTDGLTEARHDRELYGEERLFELLASVKGRPPAEVIQEVVAAVVAFSRQRLGDDLAILALTPVRAR